MYSTTVDLGDEVKAKIEVSVNFNPDGTIADASGQKTTQDVTAGEEPKNDGPANDLFISQEAQDQYATDIATAKANLAKKLVADNYVNGAFVGQTTTTTTEEVTTTTTEEVTTTTTEEETTTTTSTEGETTDTTTEGEQLAETTTTTTAGDDSTETTTVAAE